MKKNRLTTSYTFDFELIGMVATVKEYQLAWHLNQMNAFHLKKGDDVKIEFEDRKIIRASLMEDESAFSSVQLIRNKLIQSNASNYQYMVAELQQFDYLLKLQHQITENWADELLLKIKELSVVAFATSIDLEKIKMKDNLLF